MVHFIVNINECQISTVALDSELMHRGQTLYLFSSIVKCHNFYEVKGRVMCVPAAKSNLLLWGLLHGFGIEIIKNALVSFLCAVFGTLTRSKCK